MKPKPTEPMTDEELGRLLRTEGRVCTFCGRSFRNRRGLAWHSQRDGVCFAPIKRSPERLRGDASA